MKNQVALITGASSGIGKETACYLMKKGFHVYGTSRNVEGRFGEDHHAADLQSGGFIHMIPLDVTNDTSVEIAVATVIAEEGKIDILVSNAGMGIAGSIEDIPMEVAKAQFETNFFGSLRMVKAVLPHMRELGRGKIIVISSVAGIISIPFQGHYSASKFALEGLIEALRHEVAPFGIKACLVEPGDTKTGFTGSRTIAPDENTPYRYRFTRSLARMERDEKNGASPEAVARVVYGLIQKRNPPVRAAVGFQYKLIVFFKRLMPVWLTEKIVALLYNS